MAAFHLGRAAEDLFFISSSKRNDPSYGQAGARLELSVSVGKGSTRPTNPPAPNSFPRQTTPSCGGGAMASEAAANGYRLGGKIPPQIVNGRGAAERNLLAHHS